MGEGVYDPGFGCSRGTIRGLVYIGGMGGMGAR
jgi:hypothetical protein